MKIIIKTNRLNSLSMGQIVETGTNPDIDRRLNILLENGEAEVVGEKERKMKIKNKVKMKSKKINK